MPAARPAAQAPARPAPASRPLLVTVDDLPLGGAASRGDAAARRATTEALLAVLKKHRIPAIAFVIAGNVKTPDDEALLQRWLDEGHEIGSHSHTHPSYTALTSEAYLADVASARTALSAWLAPRQRTLRFFRFPYLQEGDTPREGESIRARRARRRPASATCRSRIDGQDWSFDRPWADAVASGDAAAIDDVRQDYLAAVRVAVTRTETLADRLLGRPAPQVLLIHANGVGAANWDAMFTWLAAHGHRFATGRRGARRRDLPRPADRSGPLGLRPLPSAGEAAAGGGGARRDRRGAADAGGGVESRRSRGVLQRLRGQCGVRVAERPDARPRRGAGALPDEVPGRRGARHAVVRDRGDRARPRAWR